MCVCVCVCTQKLVPRSEQNLTQITHTHTCTHAHTHTHTHTHTHPLRMSSFVKLCFVICEHTAGYKGEELIRDVSEEVRQMASNTAFYITPCDTVYRGINMVETAHCFNSSENCSYSVDPVICHTALTVNSV